MRFRLHHILLYMAGVSLTASLVFHHEAWLGVAQWFTDGGFHRLLDGEI